MGVAMGELGVANTILLLVEGILLQLENALYALAPTLAGQQSETCECDMNSGSAVASEDYGNGGGIGVGGCSSVLEQWHNCDGIAVGHSL